MGVMVPNTESGVLERDMRTWISLAAAALLTAALTACSGTTPTQSGQSSQSGVTVFGTIDTSISHTR